jgi:hypothetical protein
MAGMSDESIEGSLWFHMYRHLYDSCKLDQFSKSAVCPHHHEALERTRARSQRFTHGMDPIEDFIASIG